MKFRKFVLIFNRNFKLNFTWYFLEKIDFAYFFLVFLATYKKSIYWVKFFFLISQKNHFCYRQVYFKHELNYVKKRVYFEFLFRNSKMSNSQVFCIFLVINVILYWVIYEKYIKSRTCIFTYTCMFVCQNFLKFKLHVNLKLKIVWMRKFITRINIFISFPDW